MKKICTLICLIPFLTCTAQKNYENYRYIKIQTGLFINSEDLKLGGGKHTLQIEILKNWQAELNIYGMGNYARSLEILATENVSNMLLLKDVGISRTIKTYKNQKSNIKFLIGAGFSEQYFEKFSNVVRVGENWLFGGSTYWYDKKMTTAQGMYIKPQIQSRVMNRLEVQLYGYANYNGYRNIYGAGLAINLFKIKLCKVENEN
jgi:hypothetical protein